MLNSGKNNSRFARQKKIIILSLVLSEKKILNETKKHNSPPPPPFKLNGRSLIECHDDIVENYFLYLLHNKCYMYLL